jgi:hypothetical protein
MPNEIHRKLLVAEAALDFDTAFATIDNLPAGDLCWCKPFTGLEDCDFAEIFTAISSGATSPTGTLEWYAGRAGTNLRAAAGFGNTLTDHGVEGTAADVADMLACLGPPVKVIDVATADTVYTASFRVWYPGADCQVFLYNNTDEALDGTSSPHSAYIRGWGPEIQ